MTSRVAPYEIRVPGFEGPLDLLLQLVERNSLPITEISLAQVTDSYLRRLEQVRVPAEEMSHFLVVASRLLLIKSRYLLPRPVIEEPDTDARDLAEQLRTYRRFKAAAAALRELEGRTSYTQLIPPPAPRSTGEVVSLPPAVLERALQRSLKRLEGAMREGPAVPRMRLKLADVVARGERLLKREGSVTLERLAGPEPSRSELIVAFLAVLDLVRRRRARAVQEGLFAPVILYPVEAEDDPPASTGRAGFALESREAR